MVSVWCGLFFTNVDGMANCKEIPNFWLLLLYHSLLTWFSLHNRHQTFFFSFCKISVKSIMQWVQTFSSLVQKSITFTLHGLSNNSKNQQRCQVGLFHEALLFMKIYSKCFLHYGYSLDRKQELFKRFEHDDLSISFFWP